MSAIAEVPRAASSLQETLREARSSRQAQTIIPKAIPGYGGRLVAKYRALTWKQQRAIATENESVKDQAIQELYIAADSLLAACEGVEALAPPDDEHMQAEAQDFNSHRYRLDQSLADYLGLEDKGYETARQAILAIFPSEMALIKHFKDLFEAQTGEDEEIDEALLGNSEAVSE